MLNSLFGAIVLVKQAIMKFLQDEKIEIVFNLPGVHTLPLNHILAQSNIKSVMGRHESNVAFMADGFARATGSPGFVIVTPGPGLGNVVSSCMEAYAGDVPLMVIFVDVERRDVEKGVLHGVKRPENIFADICKATFVVSDEKDFPGTLERAYRTAVSGRQGPVVVSIPFRILEKESAPPESPGPVGEERTFDTGLLEEALEGAERPAIIGGRGLQGKGLGKELDALCRDSAIPFLTSTSGKGVVSEDRDHAFGNIVGKGVGREILKSADRVIALGTRLREVDTKKRGVKITSLVHIDVDEQWLGKNYHFGSTMAADMRQAVGALRRMMAGRKSTWNMEELAEARREELAGLKERYEGLRVIDVLRRSIPADTVTVWDLNMCGYWAECHFPVFGEGTFLFPNGISPIFYAFPAAIGAKLGRSGNPCLCVTSDGSFVPVAGELATIAAYNIPVVVLVYNNDVFGVLEDYMRNRYGAEKTMALVNPDFPALARSYGIRAERAVNLTELEEIFLRRVTWDEPLLIEFRYPLFPPPWR
jgi:acetolactate synthase I/II/III large subunit